MKTMKKRFVLLCSFVKHNTDIEFLDLWFDCCRGEPSECLCEIMKMNMKTTKKRFVLLCSFVKHYSNIEFLDLWFDCYWGRDEWVSVWNNENENDEEKICFTLLFCKRQLRYWIPWSVIWLLPRLSQLSVCVK
jgi:hypothetical protein